MRELAWRTERRKWLSAMIALTFCFSAMLTLLVASPSDRIDTAAREVLPGNSAISAGMLALTSHDPIFIDGNADFTSANGVTGGSGTETDPYVIEGWEIDVSSTHGIQVQNTDAHFIITTCNVYGAGWYGNGAIYLVNCTNALVDNNTASSNWGGILLDRCANASVTNNTLSTNYDGISFSSCTNVSIANNSISSSGSAIVYGGFCPQSVISGNNISSNNEGITAWGGHDVEISYNKILGNGNGVYLIDTDNAVLRGNEISDSLWTGVYLRGINATIEGNSLTNNSIKLGGSIPQLTGHKIASDNLVNGKPVYYYRNGSGLVVDSIPVGELIIVNYSDIQIAHLDCTSIFMAHVNDSIISENTIAKGDFGVNLEHTDNVSIEDSQLSSHNRNGIYVFKCGATSITGNAISKNHEGIYIEETDSKITNNTLSDNVRDGIAIHRGYNTNISGNEFIDNGWDGIRLWYSINMDVSGNNASSNGNAGLFCGYSHDIHVTSNSLSDNGVYGLLADEQISDILIADNNISSNGEYGIYSECWDWEDTFNVTIANNSLRGNGQAGVYLESTDDALIVGNRISDNGDGINLCSCEDSEIRFNNVTSSSNRGVYLDGCENATVTNNDVSDSECGIRLYGSLSVTLYHNNFVDNTIHASDEMGDAIFWDNGYPSGGNYWDDYAGNDEMRGVDQDELGSDGIGDTPHVVDSDIVDSYPLMSPPTYPPTNAPPLAFFKVSPSTGYVNTEFSFDSSDSCDAEDFSNLLEVRWDWEDDGTWDTDWTSDKTAVHQYTVPGDYTVRLEVVDTGLLTDQTTAQVEVVDDGKPSTSAQLSGTIGENGWYVCEVEVLLEADDEWSDIDCTQFRIDGSDWQDYSAPFEISDDGTHTLEFFSEDGAGNVEDVQSRQVKIDCTAPLLSITTENGTVFDTDTVNISLTCSDPCSGVDCVEYSLDGGAYKVCDSETCIQLSDLSDGTHQLSVRILDQAGNEAVQELTFDVSIAADDTDGDEDTPADTSSYWLTVGAAIAVVAAIIIIAAFAMRGRGQKPSE